MEDEVFCAERECALDFAAKGSNAFFAHLLRLAADVDQVAGVDDQGTNIERRAQLPHAFGLLGVDLGRAPHARARRKNLKGVGADLACALDGIRSAASRTQMHPDAHGHAISLQAGHNRHVPETDVKP